MNTKPKLGLVTVLYNGVEVLEGFYNSLAQQTYKNFVLYIIDNSPDNIALNRAKELTEISNIESVFIKNNANLGVAKGNNQGIELVIKRGCNYILLLNNDIEFGENTIHDMLVYAEKNNESLMVPKIYYYGTNKIWMAGGYISKIKATNPHRGIGKEDTGQYNDIQYTNYAPTCFMLIKAAVFFKVGNMDESYFVYYDDTDFIYRVALQGYKIVYFPNVSIAHKVGFSTGGSESLFTIYYGTRNRVYFIRKNFSLFYQIVSFIFFFASRIWKYLFYSKMQKRKMILAIKEGFHMKIMVK